ncbi:MAG: aminoacyl-histidine dipeptidase [Thermomicrobiales bacterium]
MKMLQFPERSLPLEPFTRRTVLKGVAGGAALFIGGSREYSSGSTLEKSVAQTSGAVPLKDAVSSLSPQAVWENFYQITQIPRPSHHEELVGGYLAQFGNDLGVETLVDDVGNVILRKPATQSFEGQVGVILQAHMDMVPQKDPEKEHDFEMDPIEAVVEDGWVHADRTTLGADDGIGLALIMTLFQAGDIAHGPLEALFTVNEEDGMTGAESLKPGVLQGGMLVNVDSEEEGVFTIGSAGGVNIDATATYSEETPHDGSAGLRVDIRGLQGGHSGVDIDKGRGNAIKLLARLLNSAESTLDLQVSTLTGGDQYNAIPREASASIAVQEPDAATMIRFVSAFEATVQLELAATEPDIQVLAKPIEVPARVMAKEHQSRMIDALNGVPNGVVRMSDSVSGLVETSSNIGKLRVADGQFAAGILTRSSVDSARDATREMIESVFSNAGIDTDFHSEYAGWQPDPTSAIVQLASETYHDLFGKDAVLQAIHAGLETSTVGEKYSNLEMISIGPTMQNVHSPDERLEAASVEKVYELLVGILERASKGGE